MVSRIIGKGNRSEAKPPLAPIETLSSFKNQKLIELNSDLKHEKTMLTPLHLPTTPVAFCNLKNNRELQSGDMKKIFSEGLGSTTSSKYSKLLKDKIRESMSREVLIDRQPKESPKMRSKIDIKLHGHNHSEEQSKYLPRAFVNREPKDNQYTIIRKINFSSEKIGVHAESRDSSAKKGYRTD